MEKKVFNYFNLRWNVPFNIVASILFSLVLFSIAYEYFFETLEVKDIGKLLSIEVVFLAIFIYQYNNKVIVSKEGITIRSFWAKEKFFKWHEIKSIGTFKYD